MPTSATTLECESKPREKIFVSREELKRLVLDSEAGAKVIYGDLLFGLDLKIPLRSYAKVKTVGALSLRTLCTSMLRIVR